MIQDLGFVTDNSHVSLCEADRHMTPSPEMDQAWLGVRGRLRYGRLNVATATGAGLELSLCNFGYHVNMVDAEPGQPDLCAGDVVVAVAGVLLAGLSADEVRQHFADAFCDGVPLIIGRFSELMLLSPLELLD